MLQGWSLLTGGGEGQVCDGGWSLLTGGGERLVCDGGGGGGGTYSLGEERDKYMMGVVPTYWGRRGTSM